jgi:hypothetical protein
MLWNNYHILLRTLTQIFCEVYMIITVIILVLLSLAVALVSCSDLSSAIKNKTVLCQNLLQATVILFNQFLNFLLLYTAYSVL